MENIFTTTINSERISEILKPELNIHKEIYTKLEIFKNTNKIPHLIFHGASGSGKRTIVNTFLNNIYNNDKHKMKNNVMTVNCAHGRGIKFIREDLKFFAKTNIQSNNGELFKTILLINADHLTIDAQSALRRCIEQFSFNTRFFIIVENKDKLLNPILSRFCEIYVPEHIENGKIVNLHKRSIEYNYRINYEEDHIDWLYNKIIKLDINHKELVNLSEEIYEKGLSSLDLLDCIKNKLIFNKRISKKIKLTNELISKVCICFDTIKKEYRCEKLLMLYLLDYLFLRSNKDLKSITEI